MEQGNGQELLLNIDKVHTTLMGEERIFKNCKLDGLDVVAWCKLIIMDSASDIVRRGKNWYVTNADCIITVNAYSYTIITAHRRRR